MIKKPETKAEVFRADRQLSFSFLDPVRGSADSEAVGRWEVLGKEGRDEDLTRICRLFLRELGMGELESRVLVMWNPRMRSSAGRAFWPEGLIELNPRLEEMAAGEVRRTVLHELAHLIAYERYPHRAIKGHGREWRQACAEVGIPGERATHQLELPTRSMRRQWRYHCPECEKSFERVRRFKRAVACYDCCRKRWDGSYHEKFRLVEKRLIS